jgi:hypothetical protein
MSHCLSRWGASAPACMLFFGAAVLFFLGKDCALFSTAARHRMSGGGVLTHVSEALHLFSWMHWGLEHSVGHYLDF